MKLKPLGDKVVLEQNEAESKTPGGIVLPENAKEKPQRAKVVAVGPGKINENGTVNAMSVKANDEVVYARYSGSEVELGTKKYIVISESEILAVVQQ